MAVAPLVVEYTSTSVSSSQGRPVVLSATPPQRSTTFLPRWWAAKAAPTSRPSAKLASKTSRTPSKPGATQPLVSVILVSSLAGDASGWELRDRRAGRAGGPGRRIPPSGAGSRLQSGEGCEKVTDN